MSYIKNYDIGSIRLDTPKKQFIYELPLLSFGDTRGAVGLSLVFNSSLADVNDYYMSKGHKLNLQKSLLIRSGVPGIYEDGDGTRVNLIQKGNCYLFDDDSQRIIRGTSSEYVLENPDYSTETYTTLGLITSVADKYGETYLTYTYESGKLASIKYRTNKFINLSYNNLGTLSSIEYVYYEASVCSIGIAYNGAAHSMVNHYSGVRYYTAYSGGVFTAYSTDIGSAYSNDYSQKVICTKTTDTITVQKCIGSETVDVTTYKYTDYSPVGDESYSQIEVTDFYGVKSRTQLRGENALCTYEIGESDAEFTDGNYLGNVQIHRYLSINTETSIGEKQHTNEGIPLYIEGTNLFIRWTNYPDSIPNNENGIWILTGWIRLLNNNNSDAIELFVTDDMTNPRNTNTFRLPKPPIGQWSYFAVPVFWLENDIDIPITDFGEDIETKDFRVINSNCYTMPGSDGKYLSPKDSLLVYHGNSTPVYIPLGEATLKCGNVDLSANGPVCYEDLLKYKINKRKNVNTTEFYFDILRDVVTVDSSADITVIYGNNTYNLSDCYLGQYQHTTRGAIITQIIDDSNSFLTIITTDSNGNVISSQNINSNLDVVSSTANGVTTYYERTIHTATNALFTRERIPGISYVETWYTDNAVSVYNINESDNSNISYVTYNIDPVWGTVTSVVDSEGAKITDTYDDDKCALLSRKFNDNPSITNLFTYESGNLSTLANGSLKYKMSYNKGRLSAISKLDATTEDTYNSIESHSYVNNDGYVTLTDSYPSATNPLHTVTHNYDKYGRLTSISGILTNTYNSDPCCIYENKKYKGLPGDAYDPDGTAELSFDNLGCNNASAKLSTSADSLTGKTTHYGYYDDRLVAVKTTNASSTLSKEVFAYDDVCRLITDRFDYDLAGGKFVKSVITYDDEERSPVTNNRVKSYKYYVNSLAIHRAKSTNHFDSYGRINRKEIAIQSYGFNKNYTYEKTNVKSVESKYLNSTRLMKNEYDYDAFGRIVGERYIDSATKNKSYIYDFLGRLIRENNQALDKTFIYSYNGIGNIVSAESFAYTTGDVTPGTGSAQNYSYDTANPNRLTSFNGTSIPYNLMGCPTKINGYTATWTRGKLSGLVKGSIKSGTNTYTYTYNAYGQRTGRSYNFMAGTSSSSAVAIGTLVGYTKSFNYDNSGRLISESQISRYYGEENTSEKIVYLYDESSIIGIIYTNYADVSSTYYFHRNLQGDVIGIYDVFGTQVGGYAYDAWGNCTITYSTNSIASINPIRYRGYYYDSDTKLYYLNARYYNPEWRRFISPDDTAYLDPESVNGLNLYCYCGNDPVNRYDPTGYSWEWESFWQGLGYLAIGVGAIVAGSLVIASGVATWPMLLIAGVTIGAGALTTINGASEIVEAGTGYNFVEDTVFGGNSTAYTNYAQTVGTIAIVGTMICGSWYKYNVPRIRAYKALDTYIVKRKHLPGAGGNWNKFSSADQMYLRALGKIAIKNTPMSQLIPNSADSYRLLYDFGTVIGLNGEASIRLVFSYAGKIITYFPF